MNSPGANTISTAEHTVALLLALSRKIPLAYLSLKEGKWERKRFKGVEVNGKVLGISGLGRIGAEVAKRVQALGMRTLAYDPFLSPERAGRWKVELTEFKDLLRRSDYITVHTPLTEETRHLIGNEEFKLMKDGVRLINCARGGIIDEQALYEAMKSGKVAGAALDVFDSEPPTDSKLIDLDKVVVTPHLGASTREAQVNVAVEISHCIEDTISGRAIKNAVNYVQMSSETYRILSPYIKLVEKMGGFLSQIIHGGAQKIKLYYNGNIASFKVDSLSMAFTKGFLSPILEGNINDINAFPLARSRGIKIEQIKVNREEEYANSIRATIYTDKEERILEGTLFANREPRFVKIDDIYIEIEPSTYMLVINNYDRPGVIGELGTVLGNQGINIAHLSRSEERRVGKECRSRWSPYH